MNLDPKTTALVAIDLQHIIVARQLTPHSSADVVARSVQIANALRSQEGTVVFVHVLIGDILRFPVDAPNPPMADLPPNASDLVVELGEGDVVIAKRQWGAFYGTNLEQQLRRRDIKTLVMTGIATNFGVESTARAAFDQGYELVFAEDAMSSMGEGMHEFSVDKVFPRMGRIRKTDEIVAAISGS